VFVFFLGFQVQICILYEKGCLILSFDFKKKELGGAGFVSVEREESLFN
jgi:hypothetical protein